jgi:plasmid replication initiation protein
MKTEKPQSLALKKNIDAIHVDARLSLIERKLYNVLLFNSFDELLTREKHEISWTLLSELMGFDSNNIEPLREAFKALKRASVEWNILDDGDYRIGEASFISGFEFYRGKVSYSFDAHIREKLYNPRVFARINLSVQRNITRSYTLALYENCLRYLNVGSTGFIEVDTWRRLFGVYGDNVYKEFKHFNNKIVKPAISEINQVTNIIIDAELQKDGRNVTAIRFSVKQNPQLSLLEYNDGDEIAQSKAYENLISYTLPKIIARRYVLEYGEAYILEKIAITDRAFALKKIKSKTGFLIKAIESDYKDIGLEQEKRIEKARTERANQAERERKIERLSEDIKRIERANREARKALILAHLATLEADEVARLKEECSASITNDFARGDFRKKGWESMQNERAIVELVTGRYSLTLPTVDETAQSLKLPTIAELKAKKNELEAIK